MLTDSESESEAPDLTSDEDDTGHVVMVVDGRGGLQYGVVSFVNRHRVVWLALLLLAMLALSLTPVLVFPPKIDMTLDSFELQDDVIAARQDGFHAAEDEAHKFLKSIYSLVASKRDSVKVDRDVEEATQLNRLNSSGADVRHVRRASNGNSDEDDDDEVALRGSGGVGQRIVRMWTLHVVFMVDGNIFERDRLRTVRHVDLAVRHFDGYASMCVAKGSNDGRCARAASLLPYFFASDEAVEPLADIDGGVARALYEQRYEYCDRQFSPSNPRSTLLRIEYRFGTPLAGFVSSADRIDEQTERYRRFVVRLMDDVLSTASAGDVRVYYGGDVATEQEVQRAVIGDAALAIVSLALVLVFLCVHMRSLPLAVGALAQILLSFPIAYFVCRVLLDMDYVGVLSVAGLFIILGIGVDDVLVFYNTYEQQRREHSDVAECLMATYAHAARATFLTSFTTAAAFAVNVFSPIPALRLFGMFMAMLVAVNYLLVLIVFPSFMLVFRNQVGDEQDNEENEDEEEEDGQVLILDDEDDEDNDLGDDQAAIFAEKEDDDEEERNLEEEEGEEEQDDDGQLTCSMRLHRCRQAIDVSRLDRWFGGRFVDLLVRYRWPVLGAFALLMIVSLVLALQLQPASHRPRVFPAGSNVQQFLDWEDEGLLATLRMLNDFESLGNGGGHSTDNSDHGDGSGDGSGGGGDDDHVVTPVPPDDDGCDNGEHRDLCQVCGGSVHSLGALGQCDTAVPDKPDLHFTDMVDVVFGVVGIDRSTASVSDLFGNKRGTALLDDSFDIMDAQCQVYLRDLCIDMLANEAIVDVADVGRHRCLPLVFEQYCAARGYEFPIVDRQRAQDVFVGFVLWLFDQGLVTRGGELLDLGFAAGSHAGGDSALHLAWMRLSFSSSMPLGLSSFEAVDYWQRWEDYVSERNRLAPPHCAHAFHTANVWVKAFTEVIAVRSVLSGLLVSVLITVLSILAFTTNVATALLATLSISGNIGCVLGLFYVLGWDVGIIEAISISILVGLSVDYLLHMAEGYHHVPEHMAGSREARVRHALGTMGSCVLSGALTTAISCSLLIFCTVAIFSKFGVIIALNTLISLLFTLCFFTTLLLVVGPVRHQCSLARATQLSCHFCRRSCASAMHRFGAARRDDVVLDRSGNGSGGGDDDDDGVAPLLLGRDHFD
jgi:Patched family/MMPL family